MLHSVQGYRLGVVIPCYRVRDHVVDVIARIGPEIERIYVIDDACPDASGMHVEGAVRDPRVRVLRHDANKGVGGAVITGYRAALADGIDIVVKVDGDGQMDPALIPVLVQPILAGRADYAKGNRFHSVYNVRQMPAARLLGNAALSFLTKISSGYWSLFDPTNGFTAIHREALARIELANLSERYFFESDMLINLGNVRAVVRDVAMEAYYADEKSNLKIGAVAGQFFGTHLRETCKRVLYTYFLRDFSLASAQLLLGVAMLLFGAIFGGWQWIASIDSGEPASTGTVMVATLPVLLGFQLVLSFLGFDMANEPRDTLQGWHDLRVEPPARRPGLSAG